MALNIYFLTRALLWVPPAYSSTRTPHKQNIPKRIVLPPLAHVHLLLQPSQTPKMVSPSHPTQLFMPETSESPLWLLLQESYKNNHHFISNSYYALHATHFFCHEFYPVTAKTWALFPHFHSLPPQEVTNDCPAWTHAFTLSFQVQCLQLDKTYQMPWTFGIYWEIKTWRATVGIYYEHCLWLQKGF